MWHLCFRDEPARPPFFRQAVRRRMTLHCFPPTVAVVKGVVADGTPHYGSAVLSKKVAAARPQVKSS
jgi:hypothetical protein